MRRPSRCFQGTSCQRQAIGPAASFFPARSGTPRARAAIPRSAPATGASDHLRRLTLEVPFQLRTKHAQLRSANRRGQIFQRARPACSAGTSQRTAAAFNASSCGQPSARKRSRMVTTSSRGSSRPALRPSMTLRSTSCWSAAPEVQDERTGGRRLSPPVDGCTRSGRPSSAA